MDDSELCDAGDPKAGVGNELTGRMIDPFNRGRHNLPFETHHQTAKLSPERFITCSLAGRMASTAGARVHYNWLRVRIHIERGTSP